MQVSSFKNLINSTYKEFLSDICITAGRDTPFVSSLQSTTSGRSVIPLTNMLGCLRDPHICTTKGGWIGIQGRVELEEQQGLCLRPVPQR